MSIRSLRAASTCECIAITFCCFWFDETRDACHYVQMPNDAKRHAILAAADEQFAQYGYRKTSMDDIAQRLGISRASLYTYFTNKDEIFRSVSKAVHERALAAAKTHLG